MAVRNGRERNTLLSRYCSLEHRREDTALRQWVQILRIRDTVSMGLTASWWFSAKNSCKYPIVVIAVRPLYAWRRVPYMLVHCMCQLSVWELLLSFVLSLVCKTINTTVHAVCWPTSQEAASSDGILCTSEKHTAVGVRCVSHLPVLLPNIVTQLLFSSRIGLCVWNERQADGSLTASISCVLFICLKIWS
jgi:hypothetical protein